MHLGFHYYEKKKKNEEVSFLPARGENEQGDGNIHEIFPRVCLPVVV